MTPHELANETPAFRLGYWHGFMGRPPVKPQSPEDLRAYLRGWRTGAALWIARNRYRNGIN